jgi:DNA-binding FrmR family transcriptional regulator
MSTTTDRHTYRADALARLQKIEGHIRGISKMVQEERDCEDVILQVGAVKAALNQVALTVIEDHLRCCLAGPDTADKVKSLRAAIERIV